MARWALKQPWSTVFALTCSDGDDIRAARQSVRRATRKHRGHGVKLALLLDSRVAVGALAHGRSPAPAINRLLKVLLPDLLAFNAYIVPLWVPSEANPADAPSRHLSLWSWRLKLKGGLDRHHRWMREQRRRRAVASSG